MKEILAVTILVLFLAAAVATFLLVIVYALEYTLDTKL